LNLNQIIIVHHINVILLSLFNMAEDSKKEKIKVKNYGGKSGYIRSGQT
jgi:hypothetical protein